MQFRLGVGVKFSPIEKACKHQCLYFVSSFYIGLGYRMACKAGHPDQQDRDSWKAFGDGPGDKQRSLQDYFHSYKTRGDIRWLSEMIKFLAQFTESQGGGQYHTILE